MTCNACGAENRPGRKFCARCAAPLAIACPSCGAANEPGDRYCGECAAELQGSSGEQGQRAAASSPFAAPAGPAAPAPGAAPTPVAERRLVSILFADLVGFTPFAEERDSEEVRETLTRYFELASQVIGRYGGTIEKFIGDAVMAVWGAPVAREDDAERAVRAALDLVASVRTVGPGIGARAGVLTGEAAVTIGATNQGMVAGDLVNTAARLQAVAPPGAVLVGEATMRAASAAITFEEAGEQVLKGKTAPVPAWRALRVVSERGGRNRSEAIEAPFVGRDDELRLLEDLFHATVREGRSRLVSVIGPGGIGKTRLAWEFLKYLDGLLENVWYHEGRSPAYGDGISFWALGEMVRRRCGLAETDDEATTRARLAAALEEHVPDPGERRWIEPALLALLGFGSAMSAQQLFGAWRTFFERLAATGPVVLVFEDFHFADSGLLDFVDHLMEWSRTVPIYVVTLARPELLEKRPDWGAGKRTFTSQYLEPLPEPAMRELLAGLVPGLPPAAALAIVQRADGVPLYAVETVRMLLAEGRLVERGGAYAPVGDLARLAVPETLTALIASRLDALPPKDRALVQDAAVLGQSLTPAGLSAVSGADSADLEAPLSSLVRREIFRVDADPRSPERGQYAFVQALIREVAYNTLARGERKTRHLAAARYFESLGSDELAGALASHYLAAHDNAPVGPEREALAGQAWIALRSAAERAVRLGAREQAAAFYQQAITVARDPAEEADLMLGAGESLAAAGHYARAEQTLQRAYELRLAGTDRPAAARTAVGLALAKLLSHQGDEFAEDIRLLLDEFDDLPTDPSVVTLRSYVARADYLMGRGRQSVVESDAVLQTAELLDLVPVIADTLVTRGSALVGLGQAYEGLGALEAGMHLADERGLVESSLRARINLGFYLAVGDPQRVFPVVLDGVRECRRLGERSHLMTMVANLSGAALFLGELRLAVEEIDAALALDPDPTDRAWLLADAVFHKILLGEPIDESLTEIAALSEGNRDPQWVAFSHQVASYVAFGRGDHRTARSEVLQVAEEGESRAPLALASAARYALLDRDLAGAREAAAALARLSNHLPAIEAHRQAIAAGIAALEGRTTDAVALYRAALAEYDRLGLVVDRTTTTLEMLTVLDPADPWVREVTEEARQTCLRIGAVALLAKIDAMAAQRSSEAGEPARAPQPPSGGRPFEAREVRPVETG